MMNNLKQRIVAFVLITLTVFSYIQVQAADALTDLSVIMLTVQDDNQSKINTVTSDISSVFVSAILKNPNTSTVNVTLIAAVYNKNNEHMKTANKSSIVTIGSGASAKLDLSITSLQLNNSGAEAGDTIRIFFWDSTTGLQQMTGSASSQNFEQLSQKFSTNNISDYNGTTNLIKGDSWSYLAATGYVSSWPLPVNYASKISNEITNWYLATNKGNNWYLTPGGTISSEVGRILIYNYTVGDFTAGKELNIKGTLDGQSNSDLYILKTNDTLLPDGTGKITLGSSLSDNLIAHVANLPSKEDKSFNITIPANQVSAGNSILIFPEMKQGGYISNTLNVTIIATNTLSTNTQPTATPTASTAPTSTPTASIAPTSTPPSSTPSLTSDSIVNFRSDENIAAEGKWSYIDKPLLNSDGQTFGYAGYLNKGNGGTFKTNEYCADINNTLHDWFLDSTGKMYSDLRALGWVYTLDNQFGTASGGLKISGNVTKNGQETIRLLVLKTSDTDGGVVGTTVSVLYDQVVATHDLTIIIPAADCAKGNDIIFAVQKTSSTAWWVPLSADFKVSAFQSNNMANMDKYTETFESTSSMEVADGAESKPLQLKGE